MTGVETAAAVAAFAEGTVQAATFAELVAAFGTVGVGSAGGAVAAGSVWGSVASWAAMTAVSYAVNQALSPGNKRDGTAAMGSTVVTSRGPAQPRQIVYGKARVGGDMIYLRTTNNNSVLHVVIALADHESAGIDEVYINDVVIGVSDIDANGWVTSGQFSVRQPDDGLVETVIPSAGVAKLARAPTTTSLVRASSSVVDPADGQYVYIDNLAPTTGTPGISEYKIVGDEIQVHSSWNGNPIEVHYRAGVPTARFVRIKKYLGNQLTADADLVAACGDEWTSTAIGRGVTYIYVRLQYDRAIWPTGYPNITAIVRGVKDIYDPRTATTGWTDNAALCTAHYLTNQRFGRGINYSTRVVESTLIASANICDELVPLVGGGSETRYTVNGAFRRDEAPPEVLAALAGAMAGTALRIGPKWYIEAGAYYVPTLTIDDSMLLAPPSVQARLAKRDVFSGVGGTYAGPNSHYQPDSYPPILSTTYDTEDGGRSLADLPLRFTKSPAMAQRIARIMLRKVRQQITATLVLPLAGFRIRPGRNVAVTIAVLGWTAKPFYVQKTALKFLRNGQPVVEVTLRETASNIYDWSAGADEQTVDPAPNTSFDATTLRAAEFGAGDNLLPNSNFVNSLEGWSVYNDPYPATVVAQHSPGYMGGGSFVMAQLNTLYAGLPVYSFSVRPSTGNKRVPVIAGRRYEFWALAYAYRCRGAIYIDWHNEAGTFIGQTNVTLFGPHVNNVFVEDESTWHRALMFAVAPAGAAYAAPIVQKYGTASGSDSYLYIPKLYFGVASHGQNAPSPWMPSLGFANHAITGQIAPLAATRLASAHNGSFVGIFVRDFTSWIRVLPSDTTICTLVYTADTNKAFRVHIDCELEPTVAGMFSVDIVCTPAPGSTSPGGGGVASTNAYAAANSRILCSFDCTYGSVTAGVTYTITARVTFYSPGAVGAAESKAATIQLEEIKR